MDTKNQGVLPSQDINMLVDKRSITSLSKRNLGDQIQPSSLDLTLGVKAWRIRASFLPGRNFTVEERLKTVSMHELNLNRDTVLEKGCIYIVKLNEGLNLNKDIYGTAKHNEEDQRGVLKKLFSLLEKEGVANDINGYPKAPPSIRIWGGSTVQNSDMKALLPWIDWAYDSVKNNA